VLEPGKILRRPRISSTRTLRPAEYDRPWKDHELETYLTTWAKLREQRLCLNCFNVLPGNADERKRFCSERCRNAARQRRHRTGNPEAVERALKKYWEPLKI
jgi:hypothetical protein